MGSFCNSLKMLFFAFDEQPSHPRKKVALLHVLGEVLGVRLLCDFWRGPPHLQCITAISCTTHESNPQQAFRNRSENQFSRLALSRLSGGVCTLPNLVNRQPALFTVLSRTFLPCRGTHLVPWNARRSVLEHRRSPSQRIQRQISILRHKKPGRKLSRSMLIRAPRDR